ncbi:hypothetical protein KC343_g3174 [Hortaea werneckii]|uniref:Uncharacterized protein n=1 Tax=Hortaea werneckii TaxID=91943 RepID=A0A3M7F080_HORWE|nr:hypothetical protein KC317_g2984 [Hortaea werneckii]KAI7617829.1 hypothetical protein KC346_g5284 [Hortaea werneckii]KAI7633017.1 hypothetical protein KC343_g3174 [Hortaea werneckii]KAI7680412.1 hypothetical protein KC319_g2180 [Hortaea werneckii]KAI7720924.1 hypothetical protein KC322_g1711 [Hortaea werneckii]
MSGLEHHTPAAAAADNLASSTVDGAASERAESLSTSYEHPSKRWQQWRRIVGLLLVGATVFLWTASNFLASTIFADNTYSKPYLVTYVNTSFFIVPLIPILARRAYHDPEGLKQWWRVPRQSLRQRYAPIRQQEEEEGDDSAYTDSLSSRRRRHSSSESQNLLLGDSMASSQGLSVKGAPVLHKGHHAPLTVPETAWLSLEFCFIWFIANYFVAACLEYTTVASSTILTSTAGVFTLIFGTMFGVEKFTLRKLLGVLASLAGIVLISSMDLSGTNTDDEHRGDFPDKSAREIAIGDALAFLSAIMYGLYAVFMKKRIDDESRVNMPLFFGLVGLLNVLLLWPGFIILHFAGIETFEMPPSAWVTTVILCNSLASLVSDLFWAYAVLLTSPIVVTVGLSMSIPLSLIGQIVLNSQTASPIYWIGALVVVLSFIFVNHEEKKDEHPVFEGGDESHASSTAETSHARLA